MKKKIIIVMLFIVILTLKEVNATEFSAYLPAGKNYLEVANMIVNGNTVYTDDTIFVKPDTEYTLTYPGFDWIGGDMYIDITGQDAYVIGDPSSNGSCTYGPDYTICNFTTSINETGINIEIYSSELSGYIGYYGFSLFQLEEGSNSTSYEEYIAPFIDTVTPEFSGVGAYITSYQANESITTIINNHIIAVDDIDGNISNQIVIVSDMYTTNEQIVGDYNVLLSVSDSSGNEATFTLTVMVKDEIDPVISGPTLVSISVDNPPLIEDIMDLNFSMIDEYDNAVTKYAISDNYTANKNVLGEYLVTYEIADSSGNTDNLTFTIEVIDVVPPVMVGESIYNSSLSNPLYIEDIINSISFTDNYDDLSAEYPIIISENFITNELIPGTYNIYIEIADNSGNILSKTLTVNVIDDVSPSISGISSYSGSYEGGLLVSDFIDMLSVSDNIDGLSNDDIYIISDTYTNRTSEVGDFVIVFGIIDTNNNESTHQININLFDDVAPVIYVDNFIVTVNLSATFNENDALKLLLNSNELQNGNYTISTLLDEYTGNEKNPGSYIYRLSFTNENGEIFEKEFLVKVTESNSLNFEQDLVPRNIAIYGSMIGYFVFIIIKRKRLGI